MKPFSTRMMALTGAFLAVSSVSQAVRPYTDGDLLLAFRATGGNGAATDYVVNLGSAATYVNAAAPLVLDTEIGNILADLNSLYTAGTVDWFERGDVLWSISGVQKGAGNGFVTNTMFATNMQTGTLTLGQQSSTPWPRPSAFGAGAPALKVFSMGDTFRLGDTDGIGGINESTNSAFALIQPTSGANSYASFMPGGINTTGQTAFGYFAGSTTIEGSFGAGTSGVVLDLYQVAPGAGDSVFEGTFSIDNNAVVTFTPAIPEPSSIMALALGVTVLGAVRRRRAVH